MWNSCSRRWQIQANWYIQVLLLGFPLLWGALGTRQGKYPGSTSSEKLKPFQTRSYADILVSSNDFPEELGSRQQRLLPLTLGLGCCLKQQETTLYFRSDTPLQEQ